MAADLACWNIADLRERARTRLPRGIWEYAERGTEDECGMARNRAAFERVTFRPRVLRGVQSVDTSTEILGKPSDRIERRLSTGMNDQNRRSFDPSAA